MAEIRIILQSDMCAGNGESQGNTVDTDLCLDSFGLPVIPGRRIKGCLRQGAELLEKSGMMSSRDTEILFGTSSLPGILEIGDGCVARADAIRSWLEAQPDIDRGTVSRMYTSVRGQTRMENGVADPGSLRFTRVLGRRDPVSEGKLTLHVPVRNHGGPEWEDKIALCCQAVRHMGTHRNRGLGWVSLAYVPGKTEAESNSPLQIKTGKDGRVTIFYQVRLDANMIMAMRDQPITYVPGRSVIGCMASAWIRRYGEPDGTFDRMFLSTETAWSDLTPVFRGIRTIPAPLMLAWRQYASAYCNRLAEKLPRAEKLKIPEGKWAAPDDGGWCIHSVETEVNYHHRHAKAGGASAMLYSQESLPAGLVLGGSVSLPECLAEQAEQLISNAQFRFGRSKSAQYAKCSLVPAEEKSADESAILKIPEGETFFVLLESPLLLSANGRYAVDSETLRACLAEKLGADVEPECPDQLIDYARYTVLGGYHAQWHLFKPQTEALSGGSVFCFRTRAACTVPGFLRMGEFTQEGMGRCRVLTEQEMKEITGITPEAAPKQRLPERPPEQAVLLFRNAVTRQQAMDSMAATALRLFENSVLIMKDYRRIDTGRLRLMLDEASSPAQLREWIRAIKIEKKKNAGLSLMDLALGKESEAETLPPPEGEQLRKRMDVWTEAEKKQFVTEQWKPFMRILLQMIARSQQSDQPDDTEEEPV